MHSTTFREFGIASIEFIIDYWANIRDRNVISSVEPGYLSKLLPRTAPENPEEWNDILKDFNNFILPGITHWQSPNFHSFYPAGTSYPSIIGEMLIAGLNVIGFNWMASPACEELEKIVVDWLAKLFGLPQTFLHETNGAGGGVLLSSASESILIAILGARENAIKKIKQQDPNRSESDILQSLVVYVCDQCNATVMRQALIARLPIRLLKSDKSGCLTGAVFVEALLEDTANSYHPIICVATLGTTASCSMDKIEELGPICQQNDIWLHVDAAYAGAAFICSEYEYLKNAMEYVSSININLHKWFLINFDCTAMWVTDPSIFANAFNTEPIYLRHHHENNPNTIDYRHWQVALGKKFRALKVWIVLKSFGADNIRSYIRSHTDLSKLFAAHVKSDDRFLLVTGPTLGVVTFRLKQGTTATRKLLTRITKKKRLYLMPATINDKFVIRFVVAGIDAQEKDIKFAWEVIQTEVNFLQMIDNEDTKLVEGIDKMKVICFTNGNGHDDNEGWRES